MNTDVSHHVLHLFYLSLGNSFFRIHELISFSIILHIFPVLFITFIHFVFPCKKHFCLKITLCIFILYKYILKVWQSSVVNVYIKVFYLHIFWILSFQRSFTLQLIHLLYLYTLAFNEVKISKFEKKILYNFEIH